MSAPPAKNPAPGRPPSTVGVRFSNQSQEIMKQRATAAGMALEDYIRKYYWELVNEGLIAPEVEVKIPNPGPNPYQYSSPPLAPGAQPQQQFQGFNPYPQQGYPPQGYPPQGYAPQYQPNPYQANPYQPRSYQMESMFEEMKQLWMTKMLAEMIQGKRSIDEVYGQANALQQGATKKDDFSMEQMMKWQMMMNMQDRQYQQQMMVAEQKLASARSTGDKAGENQALQLITALATTQQQAQQNTTQQMMAMMQMANNTQQTMYTTALTSQNQASDRQAQERNATQQQIAQMQTTLTQTQMQAMQANSTMQIEVIKTQMENIRNVKDPLTQLIELDALRKQSPILDAAFKGAFGGGQGGGIGDMIPKLKELGIDKVIDKVSQALPAIAASLMGRRATQPLPVPEPSGAVSSDAIPMPGPMSTPTPEQLRALENTHLPQENQSVTMNIEQPEPKPQPNVGYTNLGESTTETPLYQPNIPTQEMPKPETAGYTNLVAMPPPAKKAEPQPQQAPDIPAPEAETITPETEPNQQQRRKKLP